MVDIELTLVLLENKPEGALRVWLVHGVPATSAPGASWEPITDWTKRVGNRHQVLFWRRVVTPAELCALLETCAQQGELATNSHRLPVALVQRPPILVPASGSSSALGPVHHESAWLWEWWEVEKDVLQAIPDDRRRAVNAQVRRTLGLDLDHWTDRVGNLLVFFPGGLRTRWHYDPPSATLVVMTTLAPGDALQYELEVRGWEDEDLAVARRVTMTRPTVLIPDLPPCDRFDLWIWHGGRPVHRDEGRVILKSIGFEMHVDVGARRGTRYTQRATTTQVGNDEPEPWRRWQRERRVDTRRAALTQKSQLKFYDVDGTPAQRAEAVRDLEGVLNRANRSIRLWDPYFGSRAGDALRRGTPDDDLHFIETVRNLSVHLRVLSSAEDWTAQAGSPSLEALRRRLDDEQRLAPSVYGRLAWKAWVRADTTAFHDRFIVVDDADVWLLGSSVNGLGRKHTTLIKLEYPQEIIVAFDRLWAGQTHGVGRVLPIFDGSFQRAHGP